MSGLARWSEAPTTSSTGYFCHPLGYGRRDDLPGLRRYLQPAPRRIEPCPMPHLFGRWATTGILPLPKWESSAVRFGPLALPSMVRPRHHRLRIQCTVSDASVTRSRRRADQAKARPAETKPPVWTEPATEPVAFEDLFVWIALGDDLQDLDRLDRTEIPKELHRKRSTAERRRVYSAEEKYIVKVGLDGQFSDEKRTSWSFLEPRRATSCTS